MNATKKLAAALLFLVAASAFSITALLKERFSIVACDPQNTKNYILYYGNGCPHCKIVEEYIIANNLQEKTGICGKEVWSNQANLDELKAKASVCGLDLGKLGIPMLWDKKTNKCYGGQTDKGSDEVINFLSQSK
jgi:hypothetical protein